MAERPSVQPGWWSLERSCASVAPPLRIHSCVAFSVRPGHSSPAMMPRASSSAPPAASTLTSASTGINPT